MDQPATSRPRRVPVTLAEQKRQTRQALVWAALEVFSRDGYHAANLGEIARRAGYSKGAIYSNFRGKAELFLACMDLSMQILDEGSLDPFGVDQHEDIMIEYLRQYEPELSDEDILQAVQGFGLATLEFIAASARDRRHLDALRQRVQILVDHYADAAATRLSAGDELSVEEVAQLLVALDQGFGLLQIVGVISTETSLMREGLLRLVRGGVRAPGPEASPERGLDGAGS
ncbi:MAG: helix-turn-helix domain-containing protein [Actinomycetaceae bacterium]|nr:helix-turn-helix domain-containing protein [Actinomycetaceae bacterium]